MKLASVAIIIVLLTVVALSGCVHELVFDQDSDCEEFFCDNNTDNIEPPPLPGEESGEFFSVTSSDGSPPQFPGGF